MTTELPRLLNLAGLFLGMVGVLVIFKWGPPMPDLDDDPSTVLNFPVTPTTAFENGETGQDRIDAAKRRGCLKRRHQRMSRLGLGLIGFGFLAQFAAVMLEPSP